MKKSIICIMLSLVISSMAYFDDLKFKGQIVPDAIRGENHYIILNKDGNEKGRIAPNPLRSGQGHYLIYDKKGNEAGTIRPDPRQRPLDHRN